MAIQKQHGIFQGTLLATQLKARLGPGGGCQSRLLCKPNTIATSMTQACPLILKAVATIGGERGGFFAHTAEDGSTRISKILRSVAEGPEWRLDLPTYHRVYANQ